MGITFSDHLIDSGHYDITPEQERELDAREECARRGLDPDDDAADGATVWMVVGQEMQQRRSHPPEPLSCPICSANGWIAIQEALEDWFSMEEPEVRFHDPVRGPST